MRTTLLLLLLLLVTGCAGPAPDADDGVASLASPGATDAAEDPSAGPTDPEDAFLAFAECMREHGVDLPDPGAGGGPIVVGGPGGEGEEAFDGEEFEAADEACRHLIQDAIANMPEPDPEQLAAMQEYELSVTECLRDAGLDVPDPQIEDGGGFSMQIPDGIDFEELRAATEACREQLGDPPGFGPGGGGPMVESRQ